MLPSRITYTRSLMPTTSGSSLEIIRIATPLRAIWFMMLYIFPFIQYPYNPWGFVTKTYVKGWFGVPAFICEAVTLWVLVIVSMSFFYFGAKKRGLFETKASNDR